MKHSDKEGLLKPKSFLEHIQRTGVQGTLQLITLLTLISQQIYDNRQKQQHHICLPSKNQAPRQANGFSLRSLQVTLGFASCLIALQSVSHITPSSIEQALLQFQSPELFHGINLASSGASAPQIALNQAGGSAKFSTNSQSQLLNQVTGLNDIYFDPELPRITPILFMDKQVYLQAERVWFDVMLVDTFTKLPIYYSDWEDDTYLIYYDVFHDESGDECYSSDDFVWGYSMKSYIRVYPWNCAQTGTFTIRFYGSYIAPTFKQFRVLGYDDYVFDFPATVATTKQYYAPGEKVYLTYAFPAASLAMNGTTISIYAFDWDIIYYTWQYVPSIDVEIDVPATATNTYSGSVNFTLPLGFDERKSVLNFYIYNLDTDAADFFQIPIIIRPTTMRVVFWTESFAPLVDQTYQKFYMYAFYGDYSDFPYQWAFDFPANISSVAVMQNTTVKNKIVTNVIKPWSNTADTTGFATFSIQTDFSNTLYYQVEKSTSQVIVQPYSYYDDLYTLNSQSELYFGLSNRVVNIGDAVTLSVTTNSLLNSSDTYLLVVKSKEQYVYTKFYSFTNTSATAQKVSKKKQAKLEQTNSVNTIVIPQSALPRLPGMYDVIIYRIMEPWYDYQNQVNLGLIDGDVQMDVNYINHWFEIKGCSFFYRKPNNNALSFTVTTDKAAYYPADLVNFNVTVYNSSGIVKDPVWLNILITDQSAFKSNGKTPANAPLATRLYVDNDLIFPTYGITQVNNFLSASTTAATQEMMLATQVQRYFFADFEGLRYIRYYASPDVIPEFVQLLQRYYGSSFYGVNEDPTSSWFDYDRDLIYSYFSDCFYYFYQMNYDQFVGFNQQITPWDAWDISEWRRSYYYDYSDGPDSHYTQHVWSWDTENVNAFGLVQDLTETVFFGLSVQTTDGVFSAWTVLNDNNTNYFTYVEGFSSQNQIGSGWASGSAISATNINRPDPFEVSWPTYPNTYVDGDYGELYVKVTNRLNFDFLCGQYGMSEGPIMFMNSTVVCQANSITYVPAIFYTYGVNEPAAYMFYFSAWMWIEWDDYNPYVFQYSDTYELYIQENTNFVVEAVSGRIGQSVFGEEVEYSKEVAITVPYGDSYVDNFGFAAYIKGNMTEYLVRVLEEYNPASGYVPLRDSTTFDEIASKAYVVDSIYKVMQMHSGYYPTTFSADCVSFFNTYYTQMQDYWNETQKGYSSTIGGPINDQMTAQAWRKLSQSSMAIVNATRLGVMQALLLAQRNNATGTYAPKTALTSPSSTNQMQAYITYILTTVNMTNSALQTTVKNTYGNMVNDLNYLWNTAWTQTSYDIKDQDPFLLAFAVIAFSNAGRHQNASFLACYLVKFQNATGHFTRNSTWPPNQSPFLSSPHSRAVELQSFGIQALIAAKISNTIIGNTQQTQNYLQNITRGWSALFDFRRIYDFGSPQANTLAFETLSILHYYGYQQLPSDTDTMFELVIDDYGYGMFAGTDSNVFSISYQQIDAYNLWSGYYEGMELSAWIDTMTFSYPVISPGQDDFAIYSLWAWVDNQLDRPSYFMSPFTIAVATNTSQFWLGAVPYINKVIVFNVSIENQEPFKYNNLEVEFRLPSCVQIDSSITPVSGSTISQVNYDEVNSAINFNVRSIPASTTIYIPIYLRQTGSGSCITRFVSAKIAGDDTTWVFTTY